MFRMENNFQEDKASMRVVTVFELVFNVFWDKGSIRLMEGFIELAYGSLRVSEKKFLSCKKCKI